MNASPVTESSQNLNKQGLQVIPSMVIRTPLLAKFVIKNKPSFLHPKADRLVANSLKSERLLSLARARRLKGAALELKALKDLYEARLLESMANEGKHLGNLDPQKAEEHLKALNDFAEVAYARMAEANHQVSDILHTLDRTHFVLAPTPDLTPGLINPLPFSVTISSILNSRNVGSIDSDNEGWSEEDGIDSEEEEDDDEEDNEDFQPDTSPSQTSDTTPDEIFHCDISVVCPIVVTPSHLHSAASIQHCELPAQNMKATISNVQCIPQSIAWLFSFVLITLLAGGQGSSSHRSASRRGHALTHIPSAPPSGTHNLTSLTVFPNVDLPLPRTSEDVGAVLSQAPTVGFQFVADPQQSILDQSASESSVVHPTPQVEMSMQDLMTVSNALKSLPLNIPVSQNTQDPIFADENAALADASKDLSHKCPCVKNHDRNHGLSTRWKVMLLTLEQEEDIEAFKKEVQRNTGLVLGDNFKPSLLAFTDGQKDAQGQSARWGSPACWKMMLKYLFLNSNSVGHHCYMKIDDIGIDYILVTVGAIEYEFGFWQKLTFNLMSYSQTLHNLHWLIQKAREDAAMKESMANSWKAWWNFGLHLYSVGNPPGKTEFRDIPHPLVVHLKSYGPGAPQAFNDFDLAAELNAACTTEPGYNMRATSDQVDNILEAIIQNPDYGEYTSLDQPGMPAGPSSLTMDPLYLFHEIGNQVVSEEPVDGDLFWGTVYINDV
ncbi:hypothetical protein CPB84DRAFT_1750572 [Gymnopilus junonius]|uniref:Uncharacterized protein n=1 Tax=Gymnopilus junonius TaxID=109634 RepID=A0A9P5TJ35_GYMJU|nr:hypothetical protein CPB84DRAFT_1750572 [Gymnopilus junonius]